MNIKASSKRNFDQFINSLELNDFNIESRKDLFLISINPTTVEDDTVEETGFGGDWIKPLFKKDHHNVLRLFFDDVLVDMPVTLKNANRTQLIAKAMTEDQAKKVLDFSERIKAASESNDIAVLVHCTMGKSRSVAVSYFIAELNGISTSDVICRADAEPNQQVLNLLRKVSETK